MKNGHYLWRAAIAPAFAIASAGAASAASTADVTTVPVGIHTMEAPRITQAIDNRTLTTLPGTHLVLSSAMKVTGEVDAATPLQHLQVILQPSVERQAQLKSLIDQQHDPASPQFQHWLTPAQYGENFGVQDSDVAAVTSWLSSQGFKVNGVYPGKMQIDVSGTVGQVNQAFHTKQIKYSINGASSVALANDISVPSTLQPVIAGVVGLNNALQAPAQKALNVGTWNPATRKFDRQTPRPATVQPMAIGSGGLQGLRGLVPDDLARIYGVSDLRKNGITGKGITIALIELGSALPDDWNNFVTQFDLAKYGGTFRQFNPQLGDLNNCYDVDTINHQAIESIGTVEDAEWATAMAPGAHIEVADCSSVKDDFTPASTNTYQGLFIAATNLINSDDRPNIMSFSLSYGEDETDSASKLGMDLMAAQADAEGITIFAASGNTGTNPDFNGLVIDNAGLSAGSLASSPHVTAVGGTDFADELDGTTSRYFGDTPSATLATALGYVPEIPWNDSCGNDVAAKSNGFGSVVNFCKLLLQLDPGLHYVTSQGSSSGASAVDSKPAWQRQVHNAAMDQSRDVPDVALFGGSYGKSTGLVLCMEAYPCTPNLATSVVLDADTSLAAPMFAGIQALVEQGLTMRGLAANQGNAAPTLYALAQQEYGGATGPAPASLAACNADDPADDCVFHNVTRGSTSTQCEEIDGLLNPVTGQPATTPNCAFYGTAIVNGFNYHVGLTSLDPSRPYSPKTKAYRTQPGWSFASGLGSVDAKNLLKAWRAFVHAPAAP